MGLPLWRNFIANEWIAADAERVVYNPAFARPIARVAESSREHVEQAVAAARQAFDKGPWREFTPRRRGQLLFRMAELIRAHAGEFAALETRNTGKPIVESELDIADAADCAEYYAGWATKIEGETLPVSDNAINFTLKEPVGVAALIIPWNYPFLLAIWKLAPALAAGCTVVVKPAEQTPLSILRFAELVRERIPELPPGVINVVTGAGEVVGRALVESVGVDKVSFTGGTETGRDVLRGVAESNLKKVSLELGGKSPNIFFEDADFAAATEAALFGVFLNQGEICSAGSRVLVHEPLYLKFVARMVEKAGRIRVGNPMRRSTRMGPLISEEHRQRVLQYIELGRREGRIACGGGVPEGLPGYYVQPTIIETDNLARVAREEVFGPVVVVMPFRDEEEAVRLANDTPYGLAAAVWSRDIYRCLRVARAVRAGTVWINSIQATAIESPWGGYKHSGHGRELGRYGIEEFLETKQVHISLNAQPLRWYR